jgi:hypothetical protein
MVSRIELLVSRIELQQRGQQLRRLSSPQRLHLVKSRDLLIVRQLVRIQGAEYG